MTITETAYNSVTKISVVELRVDMILAMDIVNEMGAVILAKDTSLNTTNFKRLLENGIKSASVKTASINRQRPELYGVSGKPEPASESEEHLPIKERKDYKEFVKQHEENNEVIKKQLHAISDGAQIQLDELYTLTDNVMNKLKCKSDVFAYLSSLKTADEHTFAHCNNVSLLCNLFGRWIDMPEAELINLTAAGVLHDVGKMQVDQKVLNKKGKLTDEEFAEIKKHTTYGYRILEPQNIPTEIKLAVLMHHEKIDGTGYPTGANHTQISKFAKIVAICDIYDAMTANRIYRDKICPFDVIKNFEQQSYGKLDTEYLLIFLQNIAYTYIGTKVLLNTGVSGEVVFINKGNLSRPIIKDGTKYIDLLKEKETFIQEVI